MNRQTEGWTDRQRDEQTEGGREEGRDPDKRDGWMDN